MMFVQSYGAARNHKCTYTMTKHFPKVLVKFSIRHITCLMSPLK